MGILSLLVAGGGPSEFEFTATISSTTNSYNIYSAAQAAGWPTSLKLIANVTIDSGISVYNGFNTGSWFPPGSTLNLTNNGVIVGSGGSGGAGGSPGYGNGSPGAGGGTGLNAAYPITINNAPGRVAGGGGGGGGGTGGVTGSPKSPQSIGGGGGGGGVAFGPGGSGYPGGSPGTLTAGGARGQSGVTFGGNGGGYGSAGGNGQNFNPGLTAGTGGASGAAVIGDSYITWTNTGTRNGPIIS